MKTVFSLTAAAMMALSGGVSAASAFSLSSADIPADFRLTQQHVFKGFGCSGRKYFAAAELAQSACRNQKLRYYRLRS
ncbi:putative outer membrane protein [Salmonella enterica subsp. enterica]|nr:putative outer membrane protein [Salmonella enterica subsp. enterica]